MMRWAIVGTGIIAESMARTLSPMPEAEVVAIVSRTRNRAESFASRHGIPAFHTSVAGLTHRDVDAAYVASTNDRHVEDAVTCLRAGIPVLLEKPVAVDAAGAAHVIETARETGVFLMEAMWMHFQPYWQKLERLIADGAIGAIRTISADLGIVAPHDPQRRWFNANQGGGALLDVGIYPVTFATLLAGEPISVTAVATTATTGVDEQVSMSLIHENGVVSSLSCSFISDTAIEANVGGSEGRIRVRSRFHESRGLELWRRGELIDTYDADYDGTGYEFEVAEVHRCLDAGLTESPVHPLETTLMVMRTLDRVRESMS